MKNRKTMTNNYLISIVIPIYNASRYIEKFLKIIKKLDNDQIQVIIIDDKSTDQTQKKIINYLKISNQKNVFFRKQKKNNGPGICRNEGLKIAKGIFILFLDSDDDLRMINLIALLESKKLNKKNDIIIFDYIKQKKTHELNLAKQFIGKKKIIELFLKTELDMCANFYLFNKSFLLKNKLIFKSGYYEDILFMLKTFYYVKKILRYKKVVYLKNNYSRSITNTFSLKHLNNFIKSSQNKKLFFENVIKKKYSKYSQFLQYGLRGDYIFTKKIFKKLGNKTLKFNYYKKKFIKLLDNNFKVVTKYDYIVKKDFKF